MIVTLPGIGLVTALLQGIPVRSVRAENPKPEGGKLWPGFPRQNPTLAQEVVGASHRDEKRVRELVERHPALVNAWWDWGFGDWESPLGAASHTGRRAIAEFLLERGARMDIFAAAMLGHTEVVKGFVAARPGIQRTFGPHGIPLLAHAQAGGEQAAETLAYLESLGDAGQPLKSQALAANDSSAYLGRYQYGAEQTDMLDVKLVKDRLSIVSGDGAARQLHFVGNSEFFPAGVPNVRIRFTMNEGQASALTIIDHEPLIEARRVAG